MIVSQSWARFGLLTLVSSACLAQVVFAQSRVSTLREKMVATVPLDKGGAISCEALGETPMTTSLDASLFGQKIRDYTANDFQTLRGKLAQCDALQPNQGLPPGSEIRYAPNRYNIQNLEEFVTRRLREETAAAEYEQRTRDMQDPTKRTQIEAQDKERRFVVQEAQIRGGLDGKPTRQPSANTSEQVIYCGGYFTLQRAIDALIRADITPSADVSTMQAFALQTLAQTWLTNRQGVLGNEAVERELVPVFYAGLNAGLSADIETTKRLYRSCSAAAEALGRERAKLK